MKKKIFTPILLVIFQFLIVIFQNSNCTAQVSYNYYYGNIHSQSSYSDGNKDSATSLMTTPLQDYTYARASQHIDFYGISDHNHLSAGMQSPIYYHRGIADANTANSDGSFVALYGQEWGVISGGGHVIVYGCDSLIGWDAGDYDIFVAQDDYANLWKKIIARPGVFAYLAHPQPTDYTNLFTTTRSVNADSAIIGMAARSGPAFSTNTTYSDASTSDYTARYQDALKLGYHVGIGLDHDTHNSVFGRQTAGRLVVLAPSLTRANILDAMRKMRFYSSDDWNVKVNFTISSQPMGSILSQAGSPILSVTVTDPDVAETVSSIKVYYGIPGSGSVSTILTSNTGASTLSYTHTIANLAKYYYYLEITQADGDVIWTSPIWYTRNDAASTVPVASFTTSASTTCIGQTVNLTDNSTNTPTSWSWTMAGGTPATSTLQNPTVSFSTSGTHTVTLISTNAAGSSASTSTTITVNPLPPVAATSQTICNGSPATITGSGATTYSWSSGPTTASITVSPATTTTYTVTGTSGGCSKTATSIVTVNPLPPVAATSQTICNGSPATITGSGATTYSWSSGPTTASITVSPATTTTYTVTGTSGGCSKTATSIVTVNPLPPVAATSQTICNGSPATITGSGATTYSWSSGPTTASITVSPATTTTYTVTGTSGGCSKTATSIVTVNPLPSVAATSQTICNGSPATITGSGATTYSWSSGPTTASITVSPTTTTSYTVTGTASGCTNSAISTITVNPLPSVAATSQTICNGSPASITGSGATTYSWSSGPTTASITVSPATTTSYTVTGTSGGCSKTATSTVTVNPLPTITATSVTICAGQPATITGSGALTYLWNTGATTASLTVSPATTTTYTITGTDINSCSDTATATVILTVCAGINTVSTDPVNVYPNPAQELINIELGDLIGTKIIELYDVTGRIILTEQVNNNAVQLNISEVNNGIYFIKVINEEKTISIKRVVIEK